MLKFKLAPMVVRLLLFYCTIVLGACQEKYVSGLFHKGVIAFCPVYEKFEFHDIVTIDPAGNRVSSDDVSAFIKFEEVDGFKVALTPVAVAIPTKNMKWEKDLYRFKIDNYYIKIRRVTIEDDPWFITHATIEDTENSLGMKITDGSSLSYYSLKLGLLAYQQEYSIDGTPYEDFYFKCRGGKLDLYEQSERN